MILNRLLHFWMHRDIRRIIASLTPEQREALRRTPESDLIRFHRTLGMGLRNGFRRRRFLGLGTCCHVAVRRNDTPLSYDALSALAIREIWRSLQSGV